MSSETVGIPVKVRAFSWGKMNQQRKIRYDFDVPLKLSSSSKISSPAQVLYWRSDWRILKYFWPNRHLPLPSWFSPTDRSGLLWPVQNRGAFLALSKNVRNTCFPAWKPPNSRAIGRAGGRQPPYRPDLSGTWSENGRRMGHTPIELRISPDFLKRFIILILLLF